MRSNQMEKTGAKPGRGQSFVYRFVATLLLIALVWGQAGGIASAEDTVTGVELSAPTTTVYVGEDSIALSLFATISGSSTKKDVTSNATWTTSNSAVSVSGGVVTAKSNATNVVITGKYGGYTATIAMRSIYRYSSVEIQKAGVAVDAKMNVQLGEPLILTAYGKGTDSNDSKVVTDDASWSTSNSSVATVDDGEVTLVASGTATITVSYLGRTDSVVLTVASPYKSLTLDQKGPIERLVDDDELQLKASAQLKTGGSDEVVTDKATWTTSNASVVKVSEDGEVSFVGVGTASVTATYLGVSGSVTFVVRTPYEALRTTPEKTMKLSLQDEPAEVTAYVMKDASKSEVVTDEATWTSSDLVVATVAKGADGKTYVTPKSAGTTTIKASYKGLTRQITVTVYPTVTSLKLEKETIDTYAGETGSFPAVTGDALSGDTVTISDGVVWSSDNDEIVAIEDGKWKALKTGVAKLTATLPNSKNAAGQPFTATLTINVNKKVHLLVADSNSVSIITGQEVPYPTIHVVYENGEEEDIQDKVTWKSSSANVLVKDSTLTWKGLVGSKATMTGTYLNATIKLQAVVEDEYIAYTIEPSTIDLTIKKSKSIKVTGKTKAGKKVSLGSRIEWTSSDESILTVNGTSAKALAEGNGSLTATFQGKKLAVPFSVKPKLTKLTASSPTVDLTPGATASVKITAVYENGKTVDATVGAQWKATSAKVAKVAGGTITAVAKGSTTVKATYEGKTVSIRVKVSK